MLCLLRQDTARFVQRLSAFSQLTQPNRNTCIFKRAYPPKLYRKSQTGPFRPPLKRSAYVYILEEDTHLKPCGNIQVILATDVEGLGFQGDIVTVTKKLARTHMLPVGVAEYLCPENLTKYEQVRKAREGEKRQTMTAHKTMKQLKEMCLSIPMSSSVPWTLSTTHVKVAFRISGVQLSEDCISLPEEPVTTPKEIVVHVTVNGLHKVPVRAIVYHYNPQVAAVLPPVWSDSPAAKFDIVDVISQAAQRLRGMTIDQDTAQSTLTTTEPSPTMQQS